MVSLLVGNDWGVGHQREVDPGVRHQVGLELSKINIESSIKPQTGSDGRHNLANQTVEIGVGWTLNVKVAAADIIDGFIVNHESTVRVLKGGVGCQDGIVGFNNSRGNLGGRIDGELQL